MEVIDVNNIKLDIGQIQYSKPINVNDFLTFYKVNYGENFFILKTPEMYINSEPNLIFKSPFIHVSFRGKKTNKKLDTFYNWIMEVENKIYEDVKKVYKDSIFLPSIIDYTNKIFYNNGLYNNEYVPGGIPRFNRCTWVKLQVDGTNINSGGITLPNNEIWVPGYWRVTT